jgi:hypothetical protein
MQEPLDLGSSAVCCGLLHGVTSMPAAISLTLVLHSYRAAKLCGVCGVLTVQNLDSTDTVKATLLIDAIDTCCTVLKLASYVSGLHGCFQGKLNENISQPEPRLCTQLLRLPDITFQHLPAFVWKMRKITA